MINQHFSPWFLNACLLSFGSLSFILGGGYSIAPFLMMLFFLGILFFGAEVSRNKNDIIFASVFAIVFFIGLLDTVIHDQSISNLDIFSRYLIAVLLVLSLSVQKINASFLWVGYAVGAISAGIWAVYAKIALGMVRISTEELHPIHFGNLSLLFSFISLSGVFWALTRNDKKLVFLMLLAFISGLSASLLSGTRSGWVALPLALFAVYKLYKDILPKKQIKIIVSILVLSLSALILIPQTGVQKRVVEAVSNVQNYTQGNSSTSVGLRFEMWRSAYEAFIQKPIFGWGEEAFYVFQEKIVTEKELNPMILDFNHLHNQYIEELAKRGLIGFAALILLFTIPFKLFYQKTQSDNPQVKALGVAGVVSIICMADFCLTQAMLRINSGVMVFVFSLTFLWCCLRSIENHERAHS